MEVKHTKGEWTAKTVDFHSTIKPFRVYQGTKIICDLKSYDRYNEAANIEEEANAKLIAAAPDLLEALENIVYWIKESGNIQGSVLESKAKKAINKATK